MPITRSWISSSLISQFDYGSSRINMADQSGSPQKLKLRSGLLLYPSHIRALEIELSYLREIIPARFILLVDKSGQYVTSTGQHEGIDLTSLGSLIAGDLAASGEIARLTG